MTTLERVLATLYLMAGRPDVRRTEAAVGFGAGRAALAGHSEELLGPNPDGRSTRILVTMPSEAAADEGLVRALMYAGMDCARINCAHDGPDRWERMARNLRRAADEAGRPCSILMDLPGPKLRTGPVEPGPGVLRLRPRRDAWGRPTQPTKAVLVPEDDASWSGDDLRIPVRGDLIDELEVGDAIRLRDTRRDRQSLIVTGRASGAAQVEAWDTTYLATGTTLVTPSGRRGRVGALPPLVQSLILRTGDILTLTGDLTPVAPNEHPGGTTGHHRLRIGCTLPAAIDAAALGHRVFFDDGRLAGVVIATRPGEADVRITTAGPDGSRLRAEKGINLPDSDLRIPAFGPSDDSLLRFIVEHADMVGLSFVQHVADVRAIQDRLRDLDAHLGIVLKIETVRGFAALPELLLAAMEWERIGVMVARGDLAVECGFERLAEQQEEILWLCEAAHVPVIWATQVLDQMARVGRPSRAEISDAGMGGRAECVMLNKGPHIVEAVATLDDILQRMSAHQQKKTALLRRLRSWSPDGP